MKALLTLLIIGTSSVALAQPAPPPSYDPPIRDHRYDQTYDAAHDQTYNANREIYDRSYDRQARFDDRFDRRRFRAPIMLAHEVSFMRQWNRDQRPLVIDIDSRIGGLQRLRLDRTEGRMYVDSAIIRFADGHEQTVELNQTLSARQPSITINLDHGAVTSMVVYGQTMRGRATFDVVGLRR